MPDSECCVACQLEFLVSSSRKGCGLSRPNLGLDGPHLWRPSGLRGLVVELDSFRQIRESFFLALTLTGNIDLQTLRNVPVRLAPNSRGERSLHAHYYFT